MASRDLVSEALRRPEAVVAWSLPRWDLLIRQARAAGLLARLAAILDEAGQIDQVPAAPRAHLAAQRVAANAHRDAVLREIDRVRAALVPSGIPLVLLKGAAYVAAELPVARGRLFSDIDILVPRPALAEVEAALMLQGWNTTHHDPYDQRYYRQWMHELPPLQHATRLTVIDVHHGILPQTARARPDPETLLAASQPVAHDRRLRVLAPVDMVLHSATHLFYNEDFKNGLRDLADMDSLLRHFGREPRFWNELAPRAAELDLTTPLRLALRHCQSRFETPVPPALIGVTRPTLGEAWADWMWSRGLRPDHASASDWLTAPARGLLYIRGHWLRMPAWLLARHLAVKAVRRSG